MPINIAFLLLNILAVVLLVMGYHPHFEKSAEFYKISGYTLLMISIAGILIFRGRMLMAGFARIFVGGLFIVSGLVKANDPLGFSYKLEEYFEDGALAYRIKEWFSIPGFSLEYFIQHALLLSVLICILEIVLGVLLIIGAKSKFTTWTMLVMMLFFTFLTWHTANCDPQTKYLDRNTYSLNNPAENEMAGIKLEEAKTNKEIKIISKDSKEVVVDEMRQPQCVSDCGCFGDAMKGSVGRSLTPSESLWKDLVVLYFVIWLVVTARRIHPNIGRENLIYTLSSLLIILFFSWVFGWYFPVFFALLCIVGAVWITRSTNKYIGNYGISVIYIIFVSFIVVGYVLMYDPIKDYRPYAEGSNLVEKMNDKVDGISESHFYYTHTKTGKQKIIKGVDTYTKSKIWENTDYKYDTMITKVIRPSRLATITEQFGPYVSLSEIGEAEKSIPFVQEKLNESRIDGILVKSLEYDQNMEVSMSEFDTTMYPAAEYTILDTIQIVNPEVSEINLRDYIVSVPQIVMLSVKDLEKANWKTIKNIRSIAEGCKKDGIPFIMICNASRSDINAFREKYKLNVAAFVNDETELKAISRSNPAILYIENGVVISKYPFRSIPDYQGLKNLMSK